MIQRVKTCFISRKCLRKRVVFVNIWIDRNVSPERFLCRIIELFRSSDFVTSIWIVDSQRLTKNSVAFRLWAYFHWKKTITCFSNQQWRKYENAGSVFNVPWAKTYSVTFNSNPTLSKHANTHNTMNTKTHPNATNHITSNFVTKKNHYKRNDYLTL